MEKRIPIFFAVDDRYLPYLAVTLRSLIENSSEENEYMIYVLIEELKEENKQILTQMCKKNFNIEFVNVAQRVGMFKECMHLRDYYTKATYYRFFIPEIFSQYDKGIYLDCDITVNDDISKLYDFKLGSNLVGAVSDDVICRVPTFSRYTEVFLGINRYKYFNAGILLMNLKEMRKIKIEQLLLKLTRMRIFRVAQDQDYLNVICKESVIYLPHEWNTTPFPDVDKTSVPAIVHYKINFKPWHYNGILFEEPFWKYAKMTPFYNSLINERENYGESGKTRDNEQYEGLISLAESEIESIKRENDFFESGVLAFGAVM